LTDPSLAAPARHRSILGLDLIRFLAALLVVIYHLAYWDWAPPVDRASIRQLISDMPAFPELEHVAWMGWVGVEIFFVISGFVIANSANGRSPFKFAAGRIVRLTPAIWICATITLLAVASLKGVVPPVLIDYGRTLALPLFPNRPWIDSVYWTLIVEFVFYGVVFGLLAMNRFSRIEGLAAGLGLASGGLWIAHALLGVGDWFMTTWTAQLLLLRHGCFFAAGILLWLAQSGLTLRRAAVLAVCLAGGLIEIDTLALEKAAVVGRHLPSAAPQILFLAAFAAIVLSIRFNASLKRLVGRAWPIFPVAGLMTYPLYLVHNVVGVVILKRLSDLGVERHVALLSAAVLMIVLAWLICQKAEPVVAGKLRGWLGYAEHWLRGRAQARRLLRPTETVDPAPV
jgi:peptidoglycan/LPS O-acetylase OafA/YrhL